MFALQDRSGIWCVRHTSADLGNVEVRAATPENGLQKMRNELQYRLELCPCTGEMYRDIEIELVAESGL